ncbi:VacJ family lipoprotein [Candidatus Sumerlaeota bacterium]|nr:VacJ family lipoprotein [Candidatus Sumerlaeota bacterium]
MTPRRNALDCRAALALAFCAAISFSGCARLGSKKGDRDPLIAVNRGFFWINDSLDRYIMKHVTWVYTHALPLRARKCVSNFFSNLSEPDHALNDLLQGKAKASASDVGRFATNTTVGIAGLFDPATKWKMVKHEEDLGQTLGWWGSGEGPYIMIPLFGPSTARDVPGVILSSLMKGVFFAGASATLTMPINAVSTVDERANQDENLKAVNQNAVDRYIFIREGYRQHRIFLIYDGDPPPPPSLDEDSDEENTNAPAPKPPAETTNPTIK